jgi:hypothetical protein
MYGLPSNVHLGSSRLIAWFAVLSILSTPVPAAADESFRPSPATGAATGPVSLIPQPYGMLLLEQGDLQLTLCGPHYVDLAPPEVRDQFPCGA